MDTKRKLISELTDDLRRIFKVINEYSKKAEKETGLTGPQLWALKVIADNALIKVSDLAEKMYLHASTVIGILDRLEKKEYVSRIRSSDDRRVVEIDLTEKGKKIISKSPEIAQGLMVKGLESMSPIDIKKVSEGLKIMVKLLRAQELPPQLIHSKEINIPESIVTTKKKTSKNI